MHCSYPLEICCAKQVDFDLENGKVYNISFAGGCNGNLKIISKLLDGVPIEEIISKCSGNLCRNKGTSCADQFARACTRAIEEGKA